MPLGGSSFITLRYQFSIPHLALLLVLALFSSKIIMNIAHRMTYFIIFLTDSLINNIRRMLKL